LIGIGSQISVTFTVTGTSQVPSVTLYNGATASTDNTASPYTFSYTLKAGDNGPIVYIVQAKDQAIAVTTAAFVDSSRTAGIAASIGVSSGAFVYNISSVVKRAARIVLENAHATVLQTRCRHLSRAHHTAVLLGSASAMTARCQ